MHRARCAGRTRQPLPRSRVARDERARASHAQPRIRVDPSTDQKISETRTRGRCARIFINSERESNVPGERTRARAREGRGA